jgi:predicted dehydrogenase
MPSRDELEVVGEEGSLFLDDPWHVHEPLIEIRRDDGVERVETGRANSYQLELENLSEAIRGDGELLLGRADAVGNARALQALYASAVA